MKRQGTFFVICIEAEGAIVACATLIVEFKFLHACGQVAYLIFIDSEMDNFNKVHKCI